MECGGVEDEWADAFDEEDESNKDIDGEDDMTLDTTVQVPHEEKKGMTRQDRRAMARAKYYKKQMAELKRLRAEAEALEHGLELLKETNRVRDDNSRSARTNATSMPTTPIGAEHEAVGVIFGWKEMARLQQKQRYHSEMENKRLRHLLRVHARRVDKFALQLRRLAQDDQQQKTEDITANNHRAPLLVDTPLVLKQLTNVIPSLFAQVDSHVVDSRELLTLQSNRKISVEIQEDNGGNKTVDVVGMWIMPFDATFAATIVWESFTSSGSDPMIQETIAEDEIIERTENCVKKKGYIQSDGADGCFKFQTHIVAQRWVFPHQVVIVSATLTEPIAYLGERIDGIMLGTSDWLVIEEPQHPGLERKAVQLVYRRITKPVLLDHTPKTRICLNKMLDHYSDQQCEFFERGAQTIEDRFLQASMIR